MIYRASNKRREEWCKFTLATQKFSVVDSDNNHVCKRDVFEQLYDEYDHTQIGLNLLSNNAHQHFHLVPRDGYNEAETRRQYIDEMTKEVMSIRAISLARRMHLDTHFDHTVKWMTEAMLDVFENYQAAGEAVNKKLSQ